MPYYIDLSAISLDDYKQKLPTAYLPPSRAILKENIEERFNCLKKYGLDNLKDLQLYLKKKENLQTLSKEKCFSGDYLKILLRELNSLLPKPNKLSEFAGIPAKAISALEKIGSKNTVKLYDRVKDPDSRQQLSKETGIAPEIILELARLTDLSRIKWVGTTFARMLFDLGIDSVAKAATANPEELHASINQLNQEKGYYKGTIGLNDIRIFVEAAGEVPVEMEF